MSNDVTLDAVLKLTEQLSPLDKIRLIERIAPQIERDLQSAESGLRPSLRGIWKGLNISSEEIDEARREVWSGFPRANV